MGCGDGALSDGRPDLPRTPAAILAAAGAAAGSWRGGPEAKMPPLLCVPGPPQEAEPLRLTPGGGERHPATARRTTVVRRDFYLFSGNFTGPASREGRSDNDTAG